MIWRCLGACLAFAQFAAFALSAAFALPATVAGADERPQGLLWNRSGLAATLPLQIKSDAGQDYLLHLRDPDTEHPVLAAYVRGGAFFRVLVPPGRYVLAFWSGTDWQDETALFGPETRHFVIAPPLAFGATITRKHGHIIDLRAETDRTVRGVSICQRFALDPESLRHKDEPGFDLPPDLQDTPQVPDRFPVPRYHLRSHICD